MKRLSGLFFVVHGYLQYGGCDWGSSHTLRYHTYLIPSSHNLKHPISFAYSANFSAVEKPAKDSGKTVTEQDVGGTIGSNGDDQFYKKESKNEVSATGTTGSAEDPD